MTYNQTKKKTVSRNRPRNGTNDGIADKDVKTAIINMLNLLKDVKKTKTKHDEKRNGYKKTHIKL